MHHICSLQNNAIIIYTLKCVLKVFFVRNCKKYKQLSTWLPMRNFLFSYYCSIARSARCSPENCTSKSMHFEINWRIGIYFMLLLSYRNFLLSKERLQKRARSTAEVKLYSSSGFPAVQGNRRSRTRTRGRRSRSELSLLLLLNFNSTTTRGTATVLRILLNCILLLN